MDHHELRVSAGQAGVRLDQFLAGELPGHSRSQIQRLIKDGTVRVAGREAKANYLVRPGDEIAVDVPAPAPAAPQPEPLPLDVLFEDADIIVINKAAGMVVHPAPGHGGGTLVNALLHHVDDLSGVGGELRPGIVHRLDRGTSGVMVVAKHDASHREMARQFHDREVEKEYEALVWGLVHQGRRIDAAIGRDGPNDRKKMSTARRFARSAVTPHHVLPVSRRRVVPARGDRDGPDAPDPRPPQRDRPPDLRRHGVRGRAPADARASARGAAARAPVPARAAAWRSRTRRARAAARVHRTAPRRPAGGPRRPGGAREARNP